MLSQTFPLSSTINKVDATLDAWTGIETFRMVMDKYPNLEIYLVGGVIRNIILDLNISPKDLDFVIAGDQVGEFISELNRYGDINYGQFRSPRWHPNRDEVYCDLMDLKKWDTGLSKCESICDVLKQFDFTGNALALDLRVNKLYDPVNGRNDLEKGLLRAVRFDFPDLPIRADTRLTKMAIHWFRYLIYAQRLNLKIEMSTMIWIKKNTQFLDQLQIYCLEFNESPVEVWDSIKRLDIH
ncbi:hypothetical protein [Methylophilus sp. Q8]|uniref:hypothetical protein n=1 Tax=Methylophilus sp. Q8 TaxID=1506586 RepID=UPI0009DDA332|nr:hypothetical protein [Methylophilus sp. Q8]